MDLTLPASPYVRAPVSSIRSIRQDGDKKRWVIACYEYFGELVS